MGLMNLFLIRPSVRKLYFHLFLCLPSNMFPSAFPTESLHVLYPSHTYDISGQLLLLLLLLL
jgi:hypothetical protein